MKNLRFCETCPPSSIGSNSSSKPRGSKNGKEVSMGSPPDLLLTLMHGAADLPPSRVSGRTLLRCPLASPLSCRLRAEQMVIDQSCCSLKQSSEAASHAHLGSAETSASEQVFKAQFVVRRASTASRASCRSLGPPHASATEHLPEGQSSATVFELRKSVRCNSHLQN